MRTLLSFVALCFVLICLAGCVTSKVTPRKAFSRANPAERAKFSSFYEVSPEALVQIARDDYNQQQVFIRVLQREFSSYSDLSNRLETVHTRELEQLKTKLKFFEQIRADFDPSIDTLFHYTTDEDYGWLVIRGDHVRRKHVFITAR